MDPKKNDKISPDDFIINLEKFEKQEKLMRFDSFWRYYIIMNLSNRAKSIARVSNKLFNQFSIKMLNSFRREVEINLKLNHPSIIKCLGYSLTNFKNKLKPVVVMEYTPQKLFDYYIYDEQFDDTKKLATLFGIASGMSYLHSHNILHRNLSPKTIYFDEFLHPKILVFENCIQIQEKNKPFKDSMQVGVFEYQSPEVITRLEYSEASDVYAFSLIIYLVILKRQPIRFFNKLRRSVTTFCEEGERPPIEEPISDAYRKLIERCWSQDPKQRPSFDQIVIELKTNPEFITEGVDEGKFRQYVKFIEKSNVTFDERKVRVNIDEVMKLRTHTFVKSSINLKLRGPTFSGDELDLTKYTMKELESQALEYNIFSIHFLDKDKKKELILSRHDNFFKDHEECMEKYLGQIYTKEIRSFNCQEIINFYRKMSIISQINHPAILNFVGFSTTDFLGKPKPVILTEFGTQTFEQYCSKQLCKVEGLFWNSTKRLIIIYGIASAMSYLHSHDIIHRDLKLENIYLDKHDLPKLSGFDIAKMITNKLGEKSDKIKGTPAYLAPEVYENKEYSKASDVYSFGFVIYEIITGQKPFEEHMSPLEIRNKLKKENKIVNIDQTINDNFSKLIQRTLSNDPSSRPTFEEILQELKNNPGFITDEVDKEDFFEYINFLETFPTTFEPSKRIKLFDDMVTSQIHTFQEIPPKLDLNNIYETEKNDLSFDYNFFDLNSCIVENIEKGIFYDVKKLFNAKLNKYYAQKLFICLVDGLSQNEVINFTRELNIISRLNHPSILKYYGYNPNDQLLDMTLFHPSIVVEYSSKGSLLNFIRKTDSKEWTETKKLISIFGIASAMSYLHSHNIIHRDLKVENIFLDELFHPKLSGFNIAKIITNKSGEKSDKIKGTPAYLAPEIYENKEYSKASDVYSFGFVIYEIITGQKPFEEHMSPLEIRNKLKKENKIVNIDQTINDNFSKLIQRTLSNDPSSRPTFEEILQELKNNPGFITDKVDKDEYFDYIKFIEDSPKTYDDSEKNQSFEHRIQMQNFEFINFSTKINIRSIYKTELNDVLLDYNFININNFEKQKLIRISDDYKLYEVIDKQTKVLYLAEKSQNQLEKFEINRIQFLKELNNNLMLNHPSLLKFIGYSPTSFKNKPFPTIVTECGVNGTLKNILEIDMKNQSSLELNETKRLIILYGIASAMSYIHSHNLIHNDLNTSNVFLDEFLFPKIMRFHLSLETSDNPIIDISQKSFSYDHFNEDIYLPPEKHLYSSKSSATDVYAFAMIAYQLIANEMPFSEVNPEIIKQICVKKLRPKFKETVPECYRKLIEKCWSDDPRERPTFDEILYHLKTNSDFINEKINKEEYKNYINMIEESQKIKNKSKLDDFIKSRNKTFRKVQIDFNKLRNPTRLVFSVNIGSIDLDRFEKKTKIGSGGFGVVYKVREKSTGNIYAAKVSIYEMDICENDTIINLSREISIISQLNHPSILQFIGFNPYNFKNKSKPVIITEYAQNNSLDAIIKAERIGCGNYEWNDTKKLINIYGIASGMAYLHKKNILHRDLKPANILLDDYLYPKIADFGLSKIMYEQDDVETKRKKPKTSGFKGTYAYCSPEIMRKQIYTKAGDVYAFGMIVYEILTAENLFEGYNVYQIILEVANGIHPVYKYTIPYCYQKLIKKCLNYEPGARPSFEQIVENLETSKSFITQNVDEEEYLNYITYIKNIDSQKQKIHLNKIDLNRIKLIGKEENEKNDNFLDLSKFEKQEIISKGDSCKLYKLKEIETSNIYFGQFLMQSIHKITNEEVVNLINEMKILSEMNHPSLLKFVGFSPCDFKSKLKPVIVTEYASNGSLENVLQIERFGKSIPGLDSTKKLIIIYGIASAMSYLHSKEIIHRSLKTATVYLDDILTPKIGDFGLSTRFKSSVNITHQSITSVKMDPAFLAPEVLHSNEYSKSSDVYAFAMIVYEIISSKIPFDEFANKNTIFDEVVEKNNRPSFSKEVPKCYQRLIERCWSQEPSERPTFDDIVYLLRVDSDFITEKVKKEDFEKYANFIDEQLKHQIPIQKVEE